MFLTSDLADYLEDSHAGDVTQDPTVLLEIAARSIRCFSTLDRFDWDRELEAIASRRDENPHLYWAAESATNIADGTAGLEAAPPGPRQARAFAALLVARYTGFAATRALEAELRIVARAPWDAPTCGARDCSCTHSSDEPTDEEVEAWLDRAPRSGVGRRLRDRRRRPDCVRR